MKTKTQNTYAAFIGLDWSDKKHDYCQSDADGLTTQTGVIASTPEAVSEFINQLRVQFSGGQVAICLEQTKGALIHQLMGVDFIDIFPINPQALANFRKAFTVSRAKDDPSDAYLLWEYLVKHFDHLRVWHPDDVNTRKLAILVQDRRNIVDMRTKLSNKLTDALKGYFPQAKQWVGSKLTSPMACQFLLQWPSLGHLKQADTQTIRHFYAQHHVRSEKLINTRLNAIANSVPLVEDAAIVDTAILKVKSLCRQILALNQDIDDYDRQIASMFKDHPDTDIFDGLPGAGPALAPRLLVALGTDRERFDTALDLATFSGIAPVTQRSGKHTFVHWRLACPKFLRQTFHEFANLSRHQSDWAKAYYHLQRSRGKSHQAAVRALAFKWIRIIYHCWKNRTIYNEHIYLKALERTKAPLLNFLQVAA
jgi:transposase